MEESYTDLKYDSQGYIQPNCTGTGLATGHISPVDCVFKKASK